MYEKFKIFSFALKQKYQNFVFTRIKFSSSQNNCKNRKRNKIFLDFKICKRKKNKEKKTFCNSKQILNDENMRGKN